MKAKILAVTVVHALAYMAGARFHRVEFHAAFGLRAIP